MRLFTTPEQVFANRANAQQSTGPKTPEGKAISARNNFRHGFTGDFTVLPWEDQSAYDRLMGALRDEHKPSCPTVAQAEASLKEQDAIAAQEAA